MFLNDIEIFHEPTLSEPSTDLTGAGHKEECPRYLLGIPTRSGLIGFHVKHGDRFSLPKSDLERLNQALDSGHMLAVSVGTAKLN